MPQDTANITKENINDTDYWGEAPMTMLVGGDASIRKVFKKTFNDKELNYIHLKHSHFGKDYLITIPCTFDSSGRIINAYIGYCECDSVMKKKFDLLITNFKKYLQFDYDDKSYYKKEMAKGKIFWTSITITIAKEMYDNDEIGELDAKTKSQFENLLNKNRCK